MSAQSIPARWTDDAVWLVQALDPGARLARLVRMSEAAYRTASFLDDRMIRSSTALQLVPMDPLMDQMHALEGLRGGWIFHIGHVGSTLISRLLGELEPVLSIREPRALRDMLHFPDEGRAIAARLVGRAMMRPLGEKWLPVVKATSFVSEIAPLLVAPGEPCLFLTASPDNYIATILAGSNSRAELDALDLQRHHRAGTRGLSFNKWPVTAAHRAAIAWACEATSLEAAAAQPGCDNVMFLDFDQTLLDMTASIEKMAAHFFLDVSRDRAEGLVSGPIMRRYSKAMEHDYSPALRRDLLADAARDNLPEINDAIARLHQLATKSELLGRALARSR